jgi:hypothetical protein
MRVAAVVVMCVSVCHRLGYGPDYGNRCGPGFALRGARRW